MYWICAGLRAAYRPFWYDELITWHISRLADLKAIWAVLGDGVDHETPLTHLAVRLSHSLFGFGHLATRLPALTGFWILLLGLYGFLKRRLPLPYALIGMMFPMLTFAWQYSFEARAYGVVLGCAAVALVAWQNVAEGHWRRLSLAVIAMSLAVGLGSHPFAALIAIPLALGETVRSVERRRLDLPVWLAMAAGALGLLTFPGAIGAAHDWDFQGLQINLSELAGFFDNALRVAIAPILLAVLAVWVLVPGEKDTGAQGPILRRHEVAAVLGFVAAPVVFYLACLVTNRIFFQPRYGLVSVIGVACCVAVTLYRATGGSRRAGTVMLVVIVAWLAASRGREGLARRIEPRVQFVNGHPLLLEALAGKGPVVVMDPLDFMAADFYLPDGMQDRIHYVTAEREAARRYVSQDLVDQLVRRAARNLPVRAHVDTLQQFTEQNTPFQLFGTSNYRCVFDELIRGGWRLTLTAHKGDAWLYEVSAPPEKISGAGDGPTR
jgi:Dolichyl-phosphate-mannose-protein mannosyltransferase